MDCSSPSLPLGMNNSLKSKFSRKPLDTALHTEQSKAEDVAQMALLSLGMEINCGINHPSDSKKSVLKRIPDESMTGINSNNSMKAEDKCVGEQYTQKEKISGKRKKADTEEEISSESSFDKENSALLRGSCTRDILEKPLDLSDRFSVLRPKDRSHGSRNRTKQAISPETLNPDPKKQLNRDLREDIHQQTMRKPLQYGLDHMQGETGQDCQLFDDLEITSPHESKRQAKSWNRDCEPASVLQPNPHMDQACFHSQQNKTSIDNVQWSIDPGADLSQYEREMTLADFKDGSPAKPEMDDMDYTYVSESILVKMKGRDKMDSDSDENERTGHDTFGEIFDRTEHGEYLSYNQEKSPSQSLDLKEECNLSTQANEKAERLTHQKQRAFVEPYFQRPERKKNDLDFPHIEVVRNKEERRKMLGHTCKECEVYYADLPEHERAKKLASCSRHRFHYIPPNTPENFWEVGFPSTQTCKERGYIKEEISPCQRPRRRQPYNAMFSPKVNEQKI
ncbi:hypothetical protein GDO86_011108 [Hymenochirus boettgeri]|nr:hypothetical protein GDO86_011108 [Hymenochirus boettgeri]